MKEIIETGNRHYQVIAKRLQAHIIDKRYRIGDRLPSERQLADELTVSRSLLREALIMLEIEGLVEVRRGSGIYV
ncbi:MAG: GntR family transcriptional regulator, partial [Ostreibacterium sp.]